jgi:hypothetical protein
MKKLIAIISVLAAGFVGTAKADITMSAGQSLEMQSIGSSTNLSIGGSLGFAFSQDLGNGITVTMSGLSFGNDVAVVGDGIVSTASANATNSTSVLSSDVVVNTRNVDGGLANGTFDNNNVAIASVTGLHEGQNTFLTSSSTDSDAFEQISFASANGTLTYGSDVEIDYADLGVGDVLSSDLTDTGMAKNNSVLSLGNTTGNGIQYSTSFGGSAITIGYLLDNGGGADSFDTSATSDNTLAFKTAVPLGPLTATIGYTSDNSTASNTTMGVSTSMAAGNGTLSVSYISSDATTDVTQMGASYKTSLGGASVAVGYSNTDKDGSAGNTSIITGSISQSIGTGASVFAEFVSKSGTVANSSGGTDTSAVLLGSSFAF